MGVGLDQAADYRKSGSKPSQIARISQALSKVRRLQAYPLARTACTFKRCQ